MRLADPRPPSNFTRARRTHRGMANTPVAPRNRIGTPIPSRRRASETPAPETAEPSRKRSIGRGDPWRHMADTYAWVEHHCSPPIVPRATTTEEWVLEQQVIYSASAPCAPVVPQWNDGAIFVSSEELYGRRREDRGRRAVMDRAWQKARLVEEQLKEIENRIRRRRELEKEKIAEERWRTFERRREHERNEIAKTQRRVREAWQRYEKGWEDLVKCHTNDDCISFSTLPWPLVSTPSTARLDEITADDIGFFLLSPLHSEGQTTKERLKRARLIWHPDRFRKFLARVVDTDKAAVEKGAGIIARGLNDLAAREMAKTHSM